MYAEGVLQHSPGLAPCAYPGAEEANPSTPKGLWPLSSSIPDIALVPFHPVQLQELAKLLLEIELPVMLWLSYQVSLDLGRL